MEILKESSMEASMETQEILKESSMEFLMQILKGILYGNPIEISGKSVRESSREFH